MFVVLYSFTVKQNCEKQFINAWETLTALIYQYEGSLGSRLHHEQQHTYIAYAQWPDKLTWEHSGHNLPEEAEVFRQQMKDCCTDIQTIHTMEIISDQLQDKVV